MTVGPHLLGRIVNHDPASRGYTFRRTIAKPKNVSWENRAPILDQGDLGSCVGNTGVEWLNCTVAQKNRSMGTLTRPGHYLAEAQAVALYSRATQLDQDPAHAYPPVDSGSSGLGLGKALRALGYIYGFDWTFDFPSFLAALQRSPVCVGIDWTAGMFDPDANGFVEDTGEVQGGHELLARAVNFTHKYVTFRNHWGKDWGKGGECRMSFEVIERLLAHEGDVMVPRLVAS